MILPRYRAVRSHKIASVCANSVQAYAILVEARFCSKDKTSANSFTIGEDSPPSTPTSEVRKKEKSSKENKSRNEVRKSAGTSAPQKGGKTSFAPKESASEGSSTMTIIAAALGSVIAEALKSSFEGLRDLMNAGFTGLGDLIAPHAHEEPDADDVNDDGDSNGSKDDDESLVEGEPSAKKSRLDKPEKNRNPLISKLTKTLSSTSMLAPPSTGTLHPSWIKS